MKLKLSFVLLTVLTLLLIACKEGGKKEPGIETDQKLDTHRSGFATKR